jgi:arabinogalactan endo-1,4-beta-galactosidase
MSEPYNPERHAEQVFATALNRHASPNGALRTLSERIAKVAGVGNGVVYWHGTWMNNEQATLACAAYKALLVKNGFLAVQS